MTIRIRRTGRRSVVALLAAACFLTAAGSDPPDSELNPVTGIIETTDVSSDSGNSDVRFVADPGGGCARFVFLVTSSPFEDLGPRLTITEEGDTWVVWWRDDVYDTVLARKHTLATDSWSEEIIVGEKLESGSRPELVHDGSTAWVVYEIDDTAGGTSIAVGAIHDGPDPVGARRILATAFYEGDIDPAIVFAEGQLWVSWVDSDSEVGWSAYDPASGVWQAAAYEPYAADSVEQARQRIRAAVLGD